VGRLTSAAVALRCYPQAAAAAANCSRGAAARRAPPGNVAADAGKQQCFLFPDTENERLEASAAARVPQDLPEHIRRNSAKRPALTLGPLNAGGQHRLVGAHSVLQTQASSTSAPESCVEVEVARALLANNLNSPNECAPARDW